MSLIDEVLSIMGKVMKLTVFRSIKTKIDAWKRGKNYWHKLCFYIPYAWRFFLLQQPEPLIYGIALTDRCNMNCRGCRVSNTGRPDMSWAELVNKMESAWNRGFRELYFSGGEPMLWRGGEYTLKDLIAKAKQIGFFHVHIYTNGLMGIETSADMVWVSMDGLPEVFEKRRGYYFYQVERIVRESQYPKIALIYVIDSNTEIGIEPFLQWVQESKFPVIGVMFYFHTPYYGYDDLYLAKELRDPIIDRLLTCIKKGLPILNSRAGFLALKSGKWPRRLPVARVLDVDGESICCRAPHETCADCGYAACTEITETQRLRLTALIGMRKYL
jgi:MoaA/NifB/PqqE/SkfB family radical SAM enzyme